jgi:hypothetical protein
MFCRCAESGKTSVWQDGPSSHCRRNKILPLSPACATKYLCQMYKSEQGAPLRHSRVFELNGEKKGTYPPWAIGHPVFQFPPK